MGNKVLDRRIANMAEFERTYKNMSGEQLVHAMNQANWQGAPIDEALTTFALGVWRDDAGFVANKVFKTLNMDAESGHYYVFDSAAIDIPTAGVVAENSMAPEMKLPELSTDTYRIKREGNGVWVSDQAVRRAGNVGFSAFQFASKVQLRGLKVTKEKRFFDQYFKTGVWGIDAQGVASGGSPTGDQFYKWNAPSTATPISDLRALAAKVKLAIGVNPTTLTIAENAWNALIECQQTLDTLSAITGNLSGNYDSSMVTEALVARAIGIDEVIVSSAVYRAKEGASATPFASGNALLSYSPKTGANDIFTPSSGVIFQMADVGNGAEGQVNTHYHSERYSTWMDAFFNTDMKLTMSKGAAYLYDII
ncbi:MAG: hypothetical protein WC292_00130 [Clostridia bacterium]